MKTREEIEWIFKRTFEKFFYDDIIYDNGVLVNGNSNNKDDLVVYMNHNSYNELINEVIEITLKDEK